MISDGNNNHTNSHYCISVKNLVKSYDTHNLKRNVIDDISFDIDYGTVFGFLGPNGAGKTTTIKILTGILQPTQGSIKILDKEINKSNNFNEIKKRIGVITQNPSFESNLTVERSMELYGFLWGITGNKNKDKVRELLDIFELTSVKDVRNEDLSIGQRRRVQIAREFLHEMDLLFLDEPTVGLDPRARRNLLNYIKKQVKLGLTVFFTTHIMEEVDYLCDKICIINHGKIIAFDTPTGLKQKYGEAKTIELTFKDTPNKSFIDLLKSPISRKDSRNDDSGNDNSNKNSSYIDVIGKHAVTITVNNAEEIISEILQLVSRNGLQIESIAINSPSLEEVFLSIVNDDSGEM